MKEFSTLTMLGRARRLRQLAGTALEHWELEVARLRLLSNWTNGIFRVDTVDGRKLVLRICEPTCCHGVEEIAAEVAWLSALDRDTDLGIPAPVRTRDGELTIIVETEGVPEPRHCMLQSWVPGVDLAERLTPTSYAELGRITALLHLHAASFRFRDGVTIRSMNRVFPWSAPGFEHFERILIFDPRCAHLFPGDRLGIFYTAIDRAQAEIDHIFRSCIPPRIIHQDLHPWNVKICRGRLYILDFEDLIMGHPIQDIATALFYVRFGRENSRELTAAFREGYERLLPWPEERSGQIDILIASRSLLLVNFLLSQENLDVKRKAPEYVERTEKRLLELIPEIRSD